VSAFRQERHPSIRAYWLKQPRWSHRQLKLKVNHVASIPGTFAFAKEALRSPPAQPHFRRHALGKLLDPDAAGGGFAEMHRLSVHAQRHGLVVLAL
jgi:hypothetical protein